MARRLTDAERSERAHAKAIKALERFEKLVRAIPDYSTANAALAAERKARGLPPIESR